MTPRSNSSLPYRQQLIAEYGVLPEIWSDLPISTYNTFARYILAEAERSVVAGNLGHAYINYRKFVNFVFDYLPQHKLYNDSSNSAEQRSIQLTVKAALASLEDVVAELDREEDARQQLSADLELIDAFDSTDQPSLASKETVCQNDMSKHSEVSSNRGYSFRDLSVLLNQEQGARTPMVDPRKALGAWYSDIPSLVTTEEIAPSRPMEVPEEPSRPTSRSLNGASVDPSDKEILKHVGEIRRFNCPLPSSRRIDISLGGERVTFLRDDFQVLFAPFLRGLPPRLLMSRSAVETNRCFFLHLGVAAGLHPFALQTAFRALARAIIHDAKEDGLVKEIVTSVLDYAGFVDANCLCFLWPLEFAALRICLVSGSFTAPIFSTFAEEGLVTRDIIIHCDGNHFTLLRPLSPTFDLSSLLSVSEGLGLVVQKHYVRACSGFSVVDFVNQLSFQ